MALVDSGCCWSLVSVSVCSPWSQLKMNILTAEDKVLYGCGVGTIMLAIDDMDPVKADVLVMTVSWWDSVYSLGWVSLKCWAELASTSPVKPLTQRWTPVSVLQSKIEPDFSTQFDERRSVWTASWLWSGDQPPNKLTNRVSYIWQKYQHELQMWLDNRWLILPYPEKELGPLTLPEIPLMTESLSAAK